MSASATPVSVELDRLATGVFGDAWAGRVAVLVGVNRRTVARVMLCGREGIEHPKAAEIADALTDALGVMMRAARLAQPRWRRIIAARASPAPQTRKPD